MNKKHWILNYIINNKNIKFCNLNHINKNNKAFIQLNVYDDYKNTSIYIKINKPEYYYGKYSYNIYNNKVKNNLDVLYNYMSNYSLMNNSNIEIHIISFEYITIIKNILESDNDSIKNKLNKIFCDCFN
jgi:hypothetical protein